MMSNSDGDPRGELGGLFLEQKRRGRHFAPLFSLDQERAAVI